MAEDPVGDFLAAVRPDAHETVRAIVTAIDATGVDFERRYTYRMLVYTLDARWHHWVTAISVGKQTVSLRFLYGKRLADAARSLRPGSTTAAFLDYASAGDVDAALVTAYVREAVELHDRR